MTPKKVVAFCAAVFVVSICLGLVITNSPTRKEAQVPEFVSVGQVSSYEAKPTYGGAKIAFEHPDGTMEMMDFCSGGTVKLLDSRYEVTWAIWYKGTPGEGCYTLTKVQRIYEMEYRGGTE